MHSLIFVFSICLLVRSVYNEVIHSEKLPASAEQLEELAAQVCFELHHGDKKSNELCLSQFLIPPNDDLKNKLTPAQIVSQTDKSVMVSVQPSKNRQLVVAVPSAKDSEMLIPYTIFHNGETKDRLRTPTSNLQIWSTELDASGAPGLWIQGPLVPKWEKLMQNYKIDIVTKYEKDPTEKYPHVQVKLRWNSTDPNEHFDVLNSCKSAPNMFYKNIGSANNFTMKKLRLNDFCIFKVVGLHGNGRLEYRTPICIEDLCEPIKPTMVESFAKEIAPGSWDIVVKWQKQQPSPLYYNVTVKANSTYRTSVAGNNTEALLHSLSDLQHYEYNVVAVTSLGESEPVYGHKTVLPQSASRSKFSLGMILTGSWSITLSVGIVVVGTLMWLKRRKPATNKYYTDIGTKSCAEGGDAEEPLAVCSDSWELRPERLLLREVVGEGAFGRVRRATLGPHSREVAVKMLKDCPSVEEIRSFRAEMELMKSVGAHPHIVSLVGCCSRGKRLLIVAEYCARGDLLNYLRCALDIMMSKRNAKYYNNNIEIGANHRNDLLKNKPQKDTKFVVNKMYDLQGVCDAELTPVDLLSFCRQIAMGMEFLSSNRVVHRDLAARNVLVTSDRTLKIADFGLSRDVYQENQYKQKGSGKLPIKWMALESLSQRMYTSLSDVWSFGVVMWEIVTIGGSPYPGIQTNQLTQLLKSGYRMPRPANCSKQLYEVMSSCWRARARDRPAFTELLQRLDALLNSACADDYLSLDVDDTPPTPIHSRYLGLLARTKRYLNINKAEIYEKPLKSLPIQKQTNHYTSPPDTLARTQVV